MTTGRSLRTAALLTATGLLAGCASQGPILAHRTSLGSLKTSISHIEFQNEQLRRQVADLKVKNREIGDQLVQEEAANGDLTARLNDARNAMKDRGYGAEPIERAADPEPPRTLPAGRSSKKRRKPPFAKIPGQLDTIPPSDTTGGGVQGPFGEPRIPRGDDPDRQGWWDGNGNWLPVARGSGLPSSRVR